MSCKAETLTATPVSERAASYHAALHSPTSGRPERAKHTQPAEPPGSYAGKRAGTLPARLAGLTGEEQLD